MVSTFPDYAAFAKSYRTAAIDLTANDPTIRDLALSLMQNDADTRAKAKTLYDSVRRNIRYVYLFLGQSPAVPHKAADILAAMETARTMWHGMGRFSRQSASADEGNLSRTPRTEPLARTTRLQIDVGSGGSATFAFWVEDAGWSTEIERTLLRLSTDQRRDQIAADRLRLRWPRALVPDESHFIAVDAPPRESRPLICSPGLRPRRPHADKYSPVPALLGRDARLTLASDGGVGTHGLDP
jgi:hypothetical protein